MLVGQLIEILKQFDFDREVMIHTLQGENVEVNGWIKFSSGRWLYMEEDFKPSKAQLQIIFKWAHDKADDFRVYLGDEFVNLDVLQCKINSAE